MNGLLKKYNLDLDENGNRKVSGLYLAEAYSKLGEDEEYKKTKNMKMSRTWLEENYWPDQVTMVAESLLKATTYLVDIKHIKRPDHSVDILMLTEWPSAYGKDLGAEISHPFQDAFVLVNIEDERFYPNKILVTPQGTKYVSKYNNPKSLNNSLNITIVHELFHAYQDEYLNVRLNDYTWFFEAVAVTMENEANKYYSDAKRGWNTSLDILTDRDAFETLKSPIPEKVEALAQKHGYIFSWLLDGLRDNSEIYKKDKNEYLKLTIPKGRWFLRTD